MLFKLSHIQNIFPSIQNRKKKKQKTDGAYKTVTYDDKFN